MRALMAAVAVLAAGAVSAQDPGSQETSDDLAYLDLLRNEAVQKDVKMTPAQVEKVAATYKEFLRMTNDLVQAAKDQLGPDTPRAEHAKVRLRIADEVHKELLKGLEKILKPDQIKRVRQIRLQSLKWLAFREPDVIKELKLTDGQQKAIAGVAANSLREENAAERDAFADGISQEKVRELANKLKEIHKKEFEAMIAKLADEQKQVWKEMVGEPFDTSKLYSASPKKRD